MWHTAVLVAGVLALSAFGAARPVKLHGTSNRLLAYATTATMELLMLGWVMLGLRLRRIPLRALLGDAPANLRAIVRDFWIAIVFWIGSMVLLGTLGIAWTQVEARIRHQPTTAQAGKPFEPTPEERKVTRTLEQIAPQNGEEIACWLALCALAGFVEEVVFRGYLQSQFIAWSHGGVAVGVVFSAMVFGAAHGYQGVRNMALLAVFGVLFSLLSLYRRSLRSCIFAHSWHDLVAGLALGVLRAHHMV
ncbi:MAG TPA: CPBP family intramembrane glutamic endopeptidase [Terracidiphilus sp.]|nr:CPBP family intramembrane glutamic endopeptidase [Terracidiphilus sp.]